MWRSLNGTEITITNCDEGYCGYLSKIVVPDEYRRKYGKMLEELSVQYFDFNNPDPVLRNRRMLGLRIITMRQIGASTRFTGEFYNAADGKIYEGSLDLLDPNHLRLTGCVLMILCRGEDWVRVSGPGAAD